MGAVAGEATRNPAGVVARSGLIVLQNRTPMRRRRSDLRCATGRLSLALYIASNAMTAASDGMFPNPFLV
jgi:hypothetical protein